MTGGNQPAALWRAMMAEDLFGVVAVAAAVHPKFYEEAEVLAERQRLFPQGARLLEQQGRVIGYALSHPWRRGELPRLNSLLGAMPTDASTYYIHDLALLPEARGASAAGEVLVSLETLARSLSFSSMSLVAVNGSRRFWEKQGFRIVESPELSAKLASYEEAAALMIKPLA